MGLEVITPTSSFGREWAPKLGFTTKANSVGLYIDCENAVMKSSTALYILGILERSQNSFYVAFTEDMDSTYVDEDQLSGAGFSGGIAVVNPTNPLKLDGKDHLEISFIHELGHAVQWLRFKAWYVGYTRSVGESRRVTKGADTGFTNTYGGGIVNLNAPANMSRGDYARNVVESHNLERHEQPVCTDLGIAGFRTRYSMYEASGFRSAYPD